MSGVNNREGAPQGASDPVLRLIAEYRAEKARWTRLLEEQNEAEGAWFRRRRGHNVIELTTRARHGERMIEVAKVRTQRRTGEASDACLSLENRISRTTPLSVAGARASAAMFAELMREMILDDDGAARTLARSLARLAIDNGLPKPAA